MRRRARHSCSPTMGYIWSDGRPSSEIRRAVNWQLGTPDSIGCWRLYCSASISDEVHEWTCVCGLKLQAFGARWRSCSADSRLQNLYVPATPYVRGARRRPKQLVVKSTTDPFAAVYPLSAVVARSREMKIGVSGLSSCSRARTA